MNRLLAFSEFADLDADVLADICTAEQASQTSEPLRRDSLSDTVDSILNPIDIPDSGIDSDDSVEAPVAAFLATSYIECASQMVNQFRFLLQSNHPFAQKFLGRQLSRLLDIELEKARLHSNAACQQTKISEFFEQSGSRSSSRTHADAGGQSNA